MDIETYSIKQTDIEIPISYSRIKGLQSAQVKFGEILMVVQGEVDKKHGLVEKKHALLSYKQGESQIKLVEEFCNSKEQEEKKEE